MADVAPPALHQPRLAKRRAPLLVSEWLHPKVKPQPPLCY